MKPKKKFRSYYCFESPISGERLPLSNGDTFGRKLGRHLYPQDRAMSSKHATITMDASRNLYIEDHGSHNKTYVNQTPIVPNEPRQIFPNDTIQIGNQRFVVRAVKEPVQSQSFEISINESIDLAIQKPKPKLASAAMRQALPPPKKTIEFLGSVELWRAVILFVFGAFSLSESDYQLNLHGPSLWSCFWVVVACILMFPLITYRFVHTSQLASRQMLYASIYAMVLVAYWFGISQPTRIKSKDQYLARTGNCKHLIAKLVRDFHPRHYTQDICRAQLISSTFREYYKVVCPDQTLGHRAECLSKLLLEISQSQDPIRTEIAQKRIWNFAKDVQSFDFEQREIKGAEAKALQVAFRVAYLKSLEATHQATSMPWIEKMLRPEAELLKNQMYAIQNQWMLETGRSPAAIQLINQIHAEIDEFLTRLP